jgi:hypothetical protein
MMAVARKLISKLEAAVRRADPNAIVERTFYDEVSNRLYVTVVDGPRKTEMVLLADEFADGDQERIDRVAEEGLMRLKRTPIG